MSCLSMFLSPARPPCVSLPWFSHHSGNQWPFLPGTGCSQGPLPAATWPTTTIWGRIAFLLPTAARDLATFLKNHNNVGQRNSLTLSGFQRTEQAKIHTALILYAENRWQKK